MSGGEMESAPRRETGGAQENGDSVPSENTPVIPGNGGRENGEGLRHSTSDAVQFLQGWTEAGPWVLTSIVPDGGGITTATFGPATLAKMRHWIEERQGVQNLYFTVNAVTRPVSAKPKKTDIRGMRAVHVDVDPRVGEDAEAERARAIKMLREYQPAATVIMVSGNGVQGFWLLDEEHPTPDEASRADAERRNLHVETLLQADACHNIDRIMRLPGTVNLPDAKKRAKGRVPAPAYIVEIDWTRIYKLDQFPRVPEKPADAGTPASGRVVVTAAPAIGLDLNSLPPGVSDRIRAIIVQGTDPDDTARYSSRSEAYWAVICAMVRAGCTDEQMMGVSLDPDFGISGHVRDQPRPQQYAARQISKARIEATEPELAELNAAHVVIESMGPSGKCRIMQRLPTAFGRDVVAFQSFEDFRNRYMHRKKVVGRDREGKDMMMALGKWWLENENRRQHKTLTFLPGGADVLDGDQLNLWNGFGVQPKAGSWALMHQHIREVLADGDDASADYIVKWAAYSVQHPDKPAEAALVFRGNLGTGKGMFGRAMLRIFGQHGVRTQGANVLDSRFNAHLRDTVLLFADEVDWDSHRSSAQLKGMVTEESLFIEPKGVDATNQPNYLHIIIASNNNWVIPAAPGERRFAVFGVPDHRKNDDAYWDALQAETEGGGLAAMLHDLLAMDLTGWHPRRNIPQTRELSHQKLAGLSGADAIVREMLMGAVAPGASDARYDAGLVLMTRPLIRWAIDNRIVNTDPGELRMADAIKRMGVTRRKLTVEGRQQWTWPLPPLAEARAAWAKALGLQVTWPDDGDWAPFG